MLAQHIKSMCLIKILLFSYPGLYKISITNAENICIFHLGLAIPAETSNLKAQCTVWVRQKLTFFYCLTLELLKVLVNPSGEQNNKYLKRKMTCLMLVSRGKIYCSPMKWKIWWDRKCRTDVKKIACVNLWGSGFVCIWREAWLWEMRRGLFA